MAWPLRMLLTLLLLLAAGAMAAGPSPWTPIEKDGVHDPAGPGIGVLQQPGVTSPIIGATKLHHLEQAVAAVDLALGDDEARRLEEPYVTRANTLS